MAPELIIGIDAGTSVLKAVAFDRDGGQMAMAAIQNRIVTLPDGGVEQDMDATWQALVETLRLLAEKVPNLAARTVALGVTGQGDGTWLIDHENRPLAPAWLWLDGRSGRITAALRRSDVGEAVFAITGTGLNTSLQSTQLKWIKQYRPEVFARSSIAFHCKDWLYLNLCDEIATDVAEGSFTYGDYRTSTYSDDVLELLELRDAAPLRPPMLDGTSHYGRLTAAAAAATGLRQGTPVVLAPVDILCTALGAGFYQRTRDVGCTILGSTGIHLRLYHQLEEIHPRNQAGYVMPLRPGGMWTGMMSNMAATLNIDWMLDMVKELLSESGGVDMERGDLLELFDRKAGEASPGATIFHPFIYQAGERGPFVEPLARAQFLGLTKSTTLFDMMRAIYESLGYAARDCYLGLGGVPSEIRLSGGAARSKVCRRILASALGVPLRVSRREESGAAGAAMIAAISLGQYESTTDVSAEWADTFVDEQAEQPDPELSGLYQRGFELYRSGYERMWEFWRDLDQLRKE